MELISAVIPTFNRQGWIAEAVRSVFEQTYPNVELIVVDDGSTDQSIDELEPFRDGRTRIIRQENRGVSAARNRGIAESKGRWIALLDSDDLWRSDKLARQLDWLDRHPHYRMVGTDETWIRRGRRVNPREKHRKVSGWIFRESLEMCSVSPSSVLVDRALFDEVGWFDEDLPICEDYDLWLRIALRYPIGLVPDTLTIKRGGHAGQLSARKAADVFRVRAILKLLEQDIPTPARQLARDALRRKSAILASGFRKRDPEKSIYYEKLAATH